MSLRIISLPFFAAVLGMASAAEAGPACPKRVIAAALKAQPASKLMACKAEKAEGKVQYEVRLATRDGRTLELDVSPEGAILLTEEPIELKNVPRAILDALKATHSDAIAKRAEKQTKPDGTVSYEVAFSGVKGKREATFSAEGKLLEEE